MVAAFDIGNSYIHVGVYRDGRLAKRIVSPVQSKYIERDLMKMLGSKKIVGAAIASVMPMVTPRVVRFLKRHYRIEPVIVSSKVDCHLKFDYRKPMTLGADRIANAVGGLARYRKDLLILSFGTATTLDVVLKDGHYSGGLITPGMGLFIDGLVSRTALLKKVALQLPQRVIGQSTEECIQSGIVNGAVVMIQGLIQAIRRECKKRLLCVATGGWGQFMAKQIKQIAYFDQDLGIFGVFKIYEYNA